MRKDEIRSLIKNVLPKYSKGSEYHNEVIDRAIEKVINQLYHDTYLRDSLALQRYTKRFGSVVAVPVLDEVITGVYYSEYPTGVNPVSFPDKASGVRRVTTTLQGGITFYPLDPREYELVTSGSYFNTITGKIGYVVTQERVEYYNMSVAVAAAGVRMDIIVPFSDYDDDDDISIPEITDMQGNTFVGMVLAILGVIVPQDNTDDNKTREINVSK